MIDAARRRLDVELPDEEVATRLGRWRAPPARESTGMLARYAKLGARAHEGAILG